MMKMQVMLFYFCLILFLGRNILAEEPEEIMPSFLSKMPEGQRFCCPTPENTKMGELVFQTKIETLRNKGNKLAQQERERRQSRGEDPLPNYVVRVAYLIPAGREPQDIAKIDYGAKFIQEWYTDQLDRFGFEPKRFIYESEDGGETVKVHVAYSSLSHAFTTVFDASEELQNLGYPIFADGQIWLEFVEGHIMSESGGLSGTGYQSFGDGNGNEGGAAKVSADLLAFMKPEMLLDNTPYDGQIIEDLGPYPMDFGRTYDSSDGETISQISSRALGLIGHELGHTFGFHHCSINDKAFNGDIMSAVGEGTFGLRGWKHPLTYPNDYTGLWYGFVLVINNNRYFNSETIFTDNVESIVFTVPNSTLEGDLPGNHERHFRATDNLELACAWSHFASDGNNGNNLIGEWLILNDANINTFIQTRYGTGSGLTVFDKQGNRKNGLSTFVWNNGNIAPASKIFIYPATVYIRDQVILNASLSFDQDSNIELVTIEWDINGDGVFDTVPSTEKVLTTSYESSGSRIITARLTDPEGGISISSPVAVKVLPRVQNGIVTR
jgi:hypothetical protein